MDYRHFLSGNPRKPFGFSIAKGEATNTGSVLALALRNRPYFSSGSFAADGPPGSEPL